jgi:gluconokinase
MKVPCSPYARIEGIVYFRRMLEKIRLNDAGELREDLRPNLGISFDDRCCKFLQVDYADVVARVREGLDDAAVLEWCFSQGFRPTEEQVEVWSDFMRKRGWNDEVVAKLVERKAESGFSDRDDIVVMFDYIDADEGRPTGGKAA